MQCPLESIQRKIEARVLSQEGQDPASDQLDQLQGRVTQSLQEITLVVLKILLLNNTNSQICCTGFPELGFSGDLVQK